MSLDKEPTSRPESPELLLEMGECELLLRWDNTMLRYFNEGDGMYDHVVNRLDDGTYLAFRASDQLQQQLIEANFPRRYDPLVDEVTLTWFSENLCEQLENPDNSRDE